jgi:hypothetical protein
MTALHPFVAQGHCEQCAAIATAMSRTSADEVASLRVQSQVDQSARRDCGNIGDEIAARRLVDLGLNPERRYFICLVMMGDPPGITCRCTSCGPTCPGWK